MAAPMPHHRTPDFAAIVAQVREDLRWLMQAEGEAVALTGTGTTGMEALVANFVDPGGLFVSVGGGKFAERWGQIARAYGVPSLELAVQWGRAAEPEALAALLDAHPEVKAVALTAVETSTGVVHPIEALCAVVRRRDDVVLLVDGITAVGVMPLPADRLGIDGLVVGSQKIFAVPPGLCAVAISPRAWRLQPSPGLPRFSLDLRREADKQATGQTAFSPAITLWMGMSAALEGLRGEGLEGLWARHALAGRAARAGGAALGLGCFAEVPCDAVTALLVPEGIDGQALVRAVRDRGVVISGGQDSLKGRIVRIGHLGSLTVEDVVMALGALGESLAQLGWGVDPRAGAAAASAIGAAR